MTASPPAGTLRSMQKILLVPLIAAVVLTLFAWPASRVGPRDVPVGVVGHAAPPVDGVEFHPYPDAARARAAIEAREIYGALTPEKVLVASAASPVVAQSLTHGAGDKPVEDVVAAPKEANGLAASVLPLVLAGILTGVLSRGRIRPLLTGAVLAGIAATLVVQSWLGVVDGDFLTNSAALSLTVLAIGALVAGLRALAGHKGAALGALTMVFVGNPFSGVATSPEMIPGGAFGQLLPPGAGGSLLRSTGYFDGAAAGQHVAVLVAYVVVGLSLIGAAALRERGRVTEPVLA